jgi:hypothetical protein
MENQRNQQGGQSYSKRDKQTLIEKRKKKKEKKIPGIFTTIPGIVEFQSLSSGVTPLASSPVCLCLLGRFGAGIWWCWRLPVVDGGWCTGQQVGGQWSGGSVGWQPSRMARQKPGMSAVWRPGGPLG